MHNEAIHLKRGREAENLALSFLLKKGLGLVSRNFRCHQGEIDLIMEHRDSLVFVEVRYRKNALFGSALESIDRKKQARLIACASYYLTVTNTNRPTRFDVIAMSPGPSEELNIEWVQDAFNA